MTFTFRQLEVFVEAAKECNFRQTADRLGISQPSISNQIRMLERWVDCKLFIRSRGASPRLSTEGKVFLARAGELLAQKRRLAPAPSAAHAKRLRLRIAAGPYLLDRFIRPALPRFLDAHDKFDLHFLPPGTARQLSRAVRAGEADIAAFTGGGPLRGVAGVELLSAIPCSLYAAPRLARAAAKDPARISALPFLMPPESSDLERWELRTLRKAAIRPRRIVARSQFADVLANLAIAGKGIAVLFDEHMAANVQNGSIVRLAPRIDSGSRVLVLGELARQRAAAPVVEFLRRELTRR